MSRDELKQDALDIVDSWLGESTGTEEKPKQPVFDARARRLGLGAKYVPHKRVVDGRGSDG